MSGGASIPGPQKRGTGGTLSVDWRSHRDRGRPPPLLWFGNIPGSGPPAHIYISRAQIAVLSRAPVSGSGMLRSVIESVNGGAFLGPIRKRRVLNKRIGLLSPMQAWVESFWYRGSGGRIILFNVAPGWCKVVHIPKGNSYGT